MKKDEAIRLLEEMKSKNIHMEYDIYRKRNEAIEMAIKALEERRTIDDNR